MTSVESSVVPSTSAGAPTAPLRGDPPATLRGDAADLRAMKRALARAPLGPKATLALTHAILALEGDLAPVPAPLASHRSHGPRTSDR